MSSTITFQSSDHIRPAPTTLPVWADWSDLEPTQILWLLFLPWCRVFCSVESLRALQALQALRDAAAMKGCRWSAAMFRWAARLRVTSTWTQMITCHWLWHIIQPNQTNQDWDFLEGLLSHLFFLIINNRDTLSGHTVHLFMYNHCVKSAKTSCWRWKQQKINPPPFSCVKTESIPSADQRGNMWLKAPGKASK